MNKNAPAITHPPRLNEMLYSALDAIILRFILVTKSQDWMKVALSLYCIP
jgi:hypothetical protein